MVLVSQSANLSGSTVGPSSSTQADVGSASPGGGPCQQLSPSFLQTLCTLKMLRQWSSYEKLSMRLCWSMKPAGQAPEGVLSGGEQAGCCSHYRSFARQRAKCWPISMG